MKKIKNTLIDLCANLEVYAGSDLVVSYKGLDDKFIIELRDCIDENKIECSLEKLKEIVLRINKLINIIELQHEEK
jgi:hypothetical protein